jgi:hypothetical protein
MAVFDVEFYVEYRHTVRVEAGDAETAAERAEETVRGALPEAAKRIDVGWYGETVVKSEEE